MKRISISIAAVVLLMLTTVVPAWGQGERPPLIVAVDYDIARFIGDPADMYVGWLWERLLPVLVRVPGIWATWVPFDADTDVAREFDLIRVWMIVVDDDLEDPESDIKFYYRVRAFGSFGPPEAPPLVGSMSDYALHDTWEPLTPPPDNAIVMSFLLRVPTLTGPSQERLRGRRDYDAFWLVEVRVSNDESPDDETGVWSAFSFFLSARTNPLLAPPNPPPFANAGVDRIVAAGSTVVLDGSQSFDASNVGFDPDAPYVFEKDILEYAWEWISGPERVDPEPRDDGNAATAQVTLAVTGNYEYRLLVEDGVNPLPSTDTVNIRVVSSLPENRGPRAIITAPTDPVAVGTTVRLSAERSSDPDGDPLTYRWRQTNAVGGPLESDEVIENFQPLVGMTEKVASWKAIKAGTYYFSLLVTDPGGLSDTAFTSVQVIEIATAGDFLARHGDVPARDAATPDVQPTSTAPVGCGGGGLLPLAAVPLLLWFGRSRSR